jgi:hypothetical protein
MRYAVERADGRVMVTTVSPMIVRANDGSAVYRRVGSRDRVQFYRKEGDDSGRRYSFNVAVDYADWEPDTIPGHTIEFPSPDQIIAGWPTADELRSLGAGDDEINMRPRRDDVAFIVTLRSGIPKDEFFNALRMRDGRVVHDMPACKTIWRDKMRRARRPKLDELDRLHNRAIGQRRQSDADAIEAQRQLLREVTANPAIEAADTPEKLKALWPPMLEQ